MFKSHAMPGMIHLRIGWMRPNAVRCLGTCSLIDCGLCNAIRVEHGDTGLHQRRNGRSHENLASQRERSQ